MQWLPALQPVNVKACMLKVPLSAHAQLETAVACHKRGATKFSISKLVPAPADSNMMVGRKRSAEAAAAPAGPPQEESFPRGGGDGLSALEHRRTRLEAEAAADRDFFSEHQRSKGKRVKTSGLQVALRAQTCWRAASHRQVALQQQLPDAPAISRKQERSSCCSSSQAQPRSRSMWSYSSSR